VILADSVAGQASLGDAGINKFDPFVKNKATWFAFVDTILTRTVMQPRYKIRYSRAFLQPEQ